MGVPVVPRYIQGSNFDNDIDRFAMVGTPNHGSSLTYYMVEGGDPAMADYVSFQKNPSFSYLAQFYRMTSELMYKTYHKLPLAAVGSLPYQFQIYSLYEDHVPSAAQLLPTYDFLSSDKGLEARPNNFLIDLNWNSNIARMGNETGRVITKLFAGNGPNTTLKNITTGPKTPILYQDGVPLSSLLTTEANGDGTVLLASSSLGLGLEQHDKAETHAALVKTYKDDIVLFIDSDAVPYSERSKALAEKVANLVDPDASTAASEIDVVLFGRARILVADPQGRRSGIEPTSGEFLDEIPGSAVAMDEEKATVNLSSATDGVYSVTVTSAFNEDYRLYVSYLDSATATQKEFSGFNHATRTNFTFTVNSAASDKIIISNIPLPPTGLKADAFFSGGLKTRLVWTAGNDPTVSGYNVYTKNIQEPYLAQIGTSMTGSFDTDHSWAENSSITPRIYAVSAVTTDGTESFLSDMVQNDDRDHDGLTDVQEVSLSSDPTKADTDSDCYSDLIEYMNASNPVDPRSIPSLPISGTCGSNNGMTVSTAPTANLCATGTASAVSGTGPWNWNCAGSNGGTTATCSAMITTHLLNLTVSGTGLGTVISTPGGIAASVSSSGSFAFGTPVTMQATAAEFSIFSGWLGECTVNAIGDCAVMMNATKNVTAIFNRDLAHMTRIGETTNYYPTIQAAYNIASPGSIVKMWGTTFTENLIADQSKAVAFIGGYDGAYNNNGGFTVVRGSLRIKKGKLVVNKFVITKGG